MEIYLGADHRGFALKEQLKSWLERQGHKVVDLGATNLEVTDDYPDFALSVAEAVAAEPDARLGIVICGSGAGMDVAANKVRGIQASLIHDAKMAVAARRDDGLNVLALGADFISLEQAQAVIESFITTGVSADARHVRRRNKIADYERD